MNLLSLAVKAPLPLVSVDTDDTMNIIKVLTATLGTKVSKVPEVEHIQPTVKNPKATTKRLDFDSCKSGVTYVLRDGDVSRLSLDKLYTKFAQLKSSLIIVNPSEARTEVFPAGFVSCPQELIEEFAQKFDAKGSDGFLEIVSALSGLSYQNMARLCMLAHSHAGHVSGASLRAVRREFFGSVRGLLQESTDVPFYVPNAKLEAWLGLDGQLFSEDTPFVLRPRGLLLDGPPGTGKTMGAKYIAREMGLPLYRLDIGSTMGKYVGESEKGLDAALEQADRCAPCVMLIDEIEKIFGGVMQSGDSGVSTRALSKLLWWLQEHRSRVLTVMTTNNAKALPPELVREGRIDAALMFPALGKQHGWAFMESLAEKYSNIAVIPEDVLEGAHTSQFSGDDSRSHAHLTGVVMSLIKQEYLQPSTTSKTPAKKATKSKTPKSGA